MFFHKSRPLATAFALTAAAMIVGATANPASAERRKADYRNDYCREQCNQRQIGIVQKRRDGVNYFYGGSDVPPPQVSYIYLRDDSPGQPYAAPQELIQYVPYEQFVPFGHHFRPWHKKMKPGHKAGIPKFLGGPQFRHSNKVHHPAAP